MISKITAISNNSYQNYRKNNQKSINNLSFRAGSKEFVKPILINAELQKLADKISSYLQIMPEYSKLSQPAQVKFGNGVIGFIIDKTKTGFSKILIKHKETSNEIQSWDSLSEFKEGIEMIVNNNGQMIEGNYYELGERNILFERNNKNIRRMKHYNEYYRPVNNDIFPWRLVKSKQTTIVGPAGFDYDREGFMSLFFEMAEPKTSFLPRK